MNTSTTPTTRFVPRVSIVGAGNVGSTLAQRIIDKNLADVVLLDILEGRPQGIALDLMEAQGPEGQYRHIIGTNNYADTVGSDVVVITAGLPRKPGMSREDLLQTNARIVAEAVRQALTYSPDALLLIITNPLDVMTYLAWKVSGLSPQRVMGMAGVLDAARFQSFIASELGVPATDVKAMVLGGHGDLMVPLPRYSTVSGIPITELLDADTIERLVERTRNGGAEVVQLMKTGGAYYAPASSAYLMVGSLLLDESRILPTAAHLQGEYQIQDLFLGVPARLGRQGVQSILELKLSEAEQAALQASAESVRRNVELVLAAGVL